MPSALSPWLMISGTSRPHEPGVWLSIYVVGVFWSMAHVRRRSGKER